MPVENHPEYQPQLDPSQEEQWEHAFGTSVRKAVDDLFTHRLIAERIEGITDDEQVESLLSRQKLILVEQIEETAGRAIDNILGYLDLFKAQPGLLLDSLPDQRDDLSSRTE